MSMTEYAGTILTYAVAAGTGVLALGIIAIALAHWRDARRRADFDGTEYTEPRKPSQHPIWRDET